MGNNDIFLFDIVLNKTLCAFFSSKVETSISLKKTTVGTASSLHIVQLAGLHYGKWSAVYQWLWCHRWRQTCACSLFK